MGVDLKKLILILSILLAGISVQASYLHTVVLEGTDDGYNVILKSDAIPVVKKTVKGNNNIILNISGIGVSDGVNAVYKGTSDVNSLVIENLSDNEMNVYIQAKDIAKSTIMAQTEDGNPVILNERFPLEKVLWSLAVLVILGMVVKSAIAITDYENSLVIKKDIKEREIELYRSFQRELQSMPSINCKIKNAYASNVMPRSRRNYKELARL